MRFLNISVSELIDFVQSPLCRNQENLPITTFRAFSQTNNPAAGANDTALIVAFDSSDTIIGYIGSLPGYINSSEGKKKVFWNSCWWVHPEKGKAAAIPLLLRFIKETDKKVVMTGFTSHTKKIILNTSLFRKTAEYKSIRLFFRIYLSDKIRNTILRTIVTVLEYPVNCLLHHLQKAYLKKNKYLRNESVAEPDDEILTFISRFMSRQLFPREADELLWIIKNPWLSTDDNYAEEDKKYYFSCSVHSRSQYFEKIFLNDILSAVILFSERDGHYQTSYIYCEDLFLTYVSAFIIYHIIQKKGLSFYTRNPRIIDYICKNKPFAVFLKHFTEDLVMSDGVASLYNPALWIQDGDGDSIFT